MCFTGYYHTMKRKLNIVEKDTSGVGYLFFPVLIHKQTKIIKIRSLKMSFNNSIACLETVGEKDHSFLLFLIRKKDDKYEL